MRCSAATGLCRNEVTLAQAWCTDDLEHAYKHRLETGHQHHSDCFDLGRSVRLGLAVSLAYPQGNLTGFAIMSIDIEAKQLQILKDMVPGLSRVAVLSNPTDAVNLPILSSI
jgi:hypothetical protein